MTHRTQAKSLGSPDWLLVAATVALIAIGLMMVYSSTFDMGYRLYGDAAYFLKRQLVWLCIGAVAMFVTSQIDYKRWTMVSIPIMVAVLAMLFALVFLGQGRQLFGQSVSPVELAKLAMIIYIGHWLASKRVEQLRRLPVGPLPFTIIVGLVAGLVMAQPDLSEAMVIVLVAVAMYFLAGADVFQFAVGILGGTAAFILVIRQIPQALERLEPFLASWRDPAASPNNQLRQGIIAIGRGGILGLGPGNGTMSYRWLPAPHTDSIFAIVGEELGLVGGLTIIALFALLAYRGFLAYRRVDDPFGKMLSAGITCWIAFQALINLAVVTGTIPFTGIALPFISVGGSSLVTCMTGVGILLSVSRAATSQGAVTHEASSVRRGDGRTRLSGPDHSQNPA